MGAEQWWIVVGGLVVLELLHGTFYLLMLAIGAASAAVMAHLGFGNTFQISSAALVGMGLCVALFQWRKKRRAKQNPVQQATPFLDVGAVVHVNQWDEAGCAQVEYRGAMWTAASLDANEKEVGKHQIVEMVGNRLMVKKVKD